MIKLSSPFIVDLPLKQGEFPYSCVSFPGKVGL